MRKACLLNRRGETVCELSECDGDIDDLAMRHSEGDDITLEWPDGRKDTYHAVMRIEIVEADQEPGYAAAMSGLGPSANPHAVNTPAWRNWNRSYLTAQGSALMNPRYAEAKREADERIAALKDTVDPRMAAMRALLDEMDTLERDMRLEDVERRNARDVFFVENAVGTWNYDDPPITLHWSALDMRVTD